MSRQNIAAGLHDDEAGDDDDEGNEFLLMFPSVLVFKVKEEVW